jgi:hypothetical protein
MYLGAISASRTEACRARKRGVTSHTGNVLPYNDMTMMSSQVERRRRRRWRECCLYSTVLGRICKLENVYSTCKESFGGKALLRLGQALAAVSKQTLAAYTVSWRRALRHMDQIDSICITAKQIDRPAALLWTVFSGLSCVDKGQRPRHR